MQQIDARRLRISHDFGRDFCGCVTFKQFPIFPLPLPLTLILPNFELNRTYNYW